MSNEARPRIRRDGPSWTTILAVLATCVSVGVVLGAGMSVVSGAARAGSSPIAHDDLVCNGGQWHTTHLYVWASGCQALFGVDWAQNFTSGNLTGQYNYSFSIGSIAEFTPNGQVVRVANPLDPYGATANATVGAHEVNFTSIFHMNVTNASGNWTPNDTPWGSGPPWTVSTTAVGETELTVVFHLLNVTTPARSNGTDNSSLSVKFDVAIASWPWVSANDLLGFSLESLGAEGSHFAFNTTSRTLAESWNQNNTTFASLVFGDQATASYPNLTSVPSPVTEQVGLFDAATPAREAVALVNFSGVPGNYSFVTYDPWVVFSPSATAITVPPPLLRTSAAALPAWAVAAAGIIAAVVGMACVATYVARSSRLRNEGLELVRGMREAISGRESNPPPSKGR